MEVELSDQQGMRSSYKFNIVFDVPQMHRKEIKAARKTNSTVEAKIESISNFGLMKVRFNQTMHTQFNWTRDLNTSNMDIWLAPANNWHLELDEPFDMTKFNFTWNVTEFNKTRMEIQITFGEEPEVSVTSVYDKIVLNFLDENVVTGFNGDPLGNSSLWLIEKIPK